MNDSREIRVVLADDHVPTRAGVRLALEASGFTILAECADADSAVAAVLRHRPDLILLALFLPGGGLAATRQIHEQMPETTIVILTASPSDEDRFEAFVAGASGYLLKDDTSAERLPAALRSVLAGEAALPRAVEKRLIEEFRTLRDLKSSRFHLLRRTGPRAGLTDREGEVLDLIAEGLSTPVVARRLGISDVTVRRHISSAVHKLGATDRRTAVERLSEGSPRARPKEGP